MSIVKKRLETVVRRLNEKYEEEGYVDEEGRKVEAFVIDRTGEKHEHKVE